MQDSHNNGVGYCEAGLIIYTLRRIKEQGTQPPIGKMGNLFLLN